MDIKNNENPICATCKRCCCAHMGCEISPEDVIRWKGEITQDTITQLLDTGYISLDWWDGDPRERGVGDCDLYPEISPVYNGFYLRMRHVNALAIDPSFDGVCKALGPTGCLLTWDQRPTGGKMLEPNVDNPGRGCTSTWGKQEAAIAWLPYHEILSNVYFSD